MTAPFMNGGPPQPQNPMVQVDMNELVNALGQAALKCAENGASAGDGDQAKGFGSAAQSYANALMAIIAPQSEGAPEGPGEADAPAPAEQEPDPIGERISELAEAVAKLAEREPRIEVSPPNVTVHPPNVTVNGPSQKALRVERDPEGNALAYIPEE